MSASGKAGHEFVPSAHFPRITKHDLEVVVEAMDKLRAALRVEDRLEAQCYKVIDAWDLRYGRLDDSDCLETIARFFAKFIGTRDREREREIRELRGWKESAMELFKAFDSQAVGKALGLQLGESVMDKVLPAILAMQAADRELVEKLEWLAAKWEKENSLRSDDSYRYPQQLRAVLAARNGGEK